MTLNLSLVLTIYSVEKQMHENYEIHHTQKDLI